MSSSSDEDRKGGRTAHPNRDPGNGRESVSAGDPAGEAWYADGLRFACQRSGNCCTGEPGSVRLNDEELHELARMESLEVWQFEELFVRTLQDGAKSLRERSDGACVLFDAERGCRAYSARPRQCRTWPFWRTNLTSPEAWEKAAKGCPGMGRGPLIGKDAIDECASNDGTSAEERRGSGPRES